MRRRRASSSGMYRTYHIGSGNQIPQAASSARKSNRQTLNVNVVLTCCGTIKPARGIPRSCMVSRERQTVLRLPWVTGRRSSLYGGIARAA